MRRREFIILLSGAAATFSSVARAQQPERTRRIGVLMMYPENDPQGQLRSKVFGRELEKVGWTVGGNLQINYHWGTGDVDWVRSAIAQVLRRGAGCDASQRRRGGEGCATVDPNGSCHLFGGGDPVGDGWVQSLAHPGGNLTGFAVMEPSLGAKLLGMLKQVAPHVARVAVLVNPDNVTHQRILALLVAAAPKFAVEVAATPVHEPAEIEAAMTRWGRIRLWLDRAIGSFDQLSPQAHHRAGGTLSAPDNLCITLCRCRWRADIIRRRYSRTVSTGGNIFRSHSQG